MAEFVATFPPMRENYLGLSVDQQNDRPDRRSGSSVIVEWWLYRVRSVCVLSVFVCVSVSRAWNGNEPRTRETISETRGTVALNLEQSRFTSLYLSLSLSRGIYEHRWLSEGTTLGLGR